MASNRNNFYHYPPSLTSFLGTRRAAQQPPLAMRSVESVTEMRNLPVNFGVVTAISSRSPSVVKANSNTSLRSNGAYVHLMRSGDEAHRRPISSESMAELSALPPIKSESFCGLRDSDYAYLPGCFDDSNRVRNSAYCYVTEDGRYKGFMGGQQSLLPSLPANSPNPYAHVSRYQDNPLSSSESSVSLSSVVSLPVNTSDDRTRMPDVFSSNFKLGAGNFFPTPKQPTNQTLNKRAFDAQSEADIHMLGTTFERKEIPNNQCLNKRLLSTESAYELTMLPSIYDNAERVLRDFSRQSLEDLRQLPSLSSYNLNQLNHTNEVTKGTSQRQMIQMLYYPEATGLTHQ